MNEIVFVVEQAPEGGFTARALGESIFTEADTRPSCAWLCKTLCIATLTKASLPKSSGCTLSAMSCWPREKANDR